MNKEKILKLINQIEEATTKLKLELDVPEREVAKKKVIRSRRRKRRKINLTGSVKTLLDDSFFSDWRKDVEVVQNLKEKFLMPRTLRRSSVTNVLRKFFAKGLLIRKKITEGKKKFLVYKKKK